MKITDLPIVSGVRPFSTRGGRLGGGGASESLSEAISMTTSCSISSKSFSLAGTRESDSSGVSSEAARENQLTTNY